MVPSAQLAEPTVVRRVFEAWSIEIPASFAETYIDEDSYWHAYDEHRSVSLTSILLTDKGRPVPAEMILRELPQLEGTPCEELPPSLFGRAVSGASVRPAKASRVISGILAVDGRLLIATITSDDLDWALQTWLSICSHPALQPPRRLGRRAARAKARLGFQECWDPPRE